MENFNEQNIAGLFPNENYNDILNFIKQISLLVPDGENKINYLSTLLSYVNAMVYGDEIVKCTAQEYSKEHASTVLWDLINEKHRHEVAKMQSERAELMAENDNLAKQNDDLNSKQFELVTQITQLNTDLSRLQKELDEKRKNGIATVTAEIAEKKNSLEAETASLENSKKLLGDAIDELKNTIHTYTIQIIGMSAESPVLWKPIDENSSILGLNYYTIVSYIDGLIKEYMQQCHVSYEEATSAIHTNCSGLLTIKGLLNSKWSEISYDAPLGYIAKRSYWSAAVDREKAHSIKEILKTIKEPVYSQRIGGTVYPFSSATVPTDVSSLTRELYYQKKVAESLARANIAEAQLQTVIQVLKNYLPEQYNVESLLGFSTSFDAQQTIDGDTPIKR